MREEVRGLAITRINDALRPGDGIVISSRVDDFRAVVRPQVGPPALLRDAAGIVMHDLDTAATAAFLRRDAGGQRSGPRWDPVLAVLGTSAPAAQALRTPLMVGLARTIYNPRAGEHVGELPDPAELCDTTALPTTGDVERFLFDAFVPAAYRPRPDRSTGREWRAVDAQRWLVTLARHLEEKLAGTTDFKWWDLRRSAPRPLIGAVVGVICGLAIGLVAGLGSQVGVGFGVGLGAGTGIALAIGLPIRALSRAGRGGHPVWSIRPGVGLAGGLAGGVLGGLTAGIASLFGIGVAPGVGGGVSAGLGVGVAAGPAIGFFGALAGTFAGGLVAGLIPGVGAGLAAGIVNGIGTTFSVGLMVGLAPKPEPARGLNWRPYGVIGGLAAGVALGVTAWLVVGPTVAVVSAAAVALVIALVSGLIGSTTEADTANSPPTVLAHDRRAFAFLALSAGTVTAIVGVVVIGLSATIEKNARFALGNVITEGLPAGLGFGLCCGLVLAFVQSAWGGFVITRVWLALRGRLPWRLVSFLVDAHEHRGVLRQAGPTTSSAMPSYNVGWRALTVDAMSSVKAWMLTGTPN
jgi:hypothetical protein